MQKKNAPVPLPVHLFLLVWDVGVGCWLRLYPLNGRSLMDP